VTGHLVGEQRKNVSCAGCKRRVGQGGKMRTEKNVAKGGRKQTNFVLSGGGEGKGSEQEGKATFLGKPTGPCRGEKTVHRPCFEKVSGTG